MLVDQPLHLGNLVRRHRFAVSKVEAKVLRRDERARLGDVLAEDFAKGGVEEMGGRMVARDVPTPLGVDLGNDGHEKEARIENRENLFLPEPSEQAAVELWIPLEVALRAKEAAAELFVEPRQPSVVPNEAHFLPRIDHLELERVASDDAGVTDLATGLGIEGRRGEAELELAGGQAVGSEDRADLADLGPSARVLVADELGDRPGVRRNRENDLLLFAIDGFHARGASRALLGFGKGLLIAGHIDGNPSFVADLDREFERESVGVVEPECAVAVEDSISFLPLLVTSSKNLVDGLVE